MKKVRAFLLAVVGVFGISVIGINAQSVGPNSIQSSTAIAQKAYSKLRGLPHYGVFDNITVVARGNTVILGGKVISLGTKSAAERAMKDITKTLPRSEES